MRVVLHSFMCSTFIIKNYFLIGTTFWFKFIPQNVCFEKYQTFIKSFTNCTLIKYRNGERESKKKHFKTKSIFELKTQNLPFDETWAKGCSVRRVKSGRVVLKTTNDLQKNCHLLFNNTLLSWQLISLTTEKVATFIFKNSVGDKLADFYDPLWYACVAVMISLHLLRLTEKHIFHYYLF